ncbi:MAG: T9SS type A sorting domain-containing protein [Bacteroidales bacterium]|jgi:hypothetical protein|nr:T9SS type A sorting domain-containing protein [Bacteroidales bacterium]
MKNRLLIVPLILIAAYSFGQIPNNSFEEWVQTNNYQNPKNWNTPNVYTSIAGQSVVSKSEDAYYGSYSAHLESKVLSFLDQTFLAPGVITLAKFNIDIFTQTFSYSGGLFLQQNVFELKGMYKYQGVGNDSAVILMYNFRNRANEDYDTIGRGYTYLNDAADWTPFTVKMKYLNGHIPDTFNVLIMSTTDEGLQNMSHNGSVLLVDSLSISTNTGIINLWEKPIALHVYPNPSASIIHFEIEKTGKNRELILYNQEGRMMVTTAFHKKIISLDISKFSSGMYTYVVVEAEKIINSGSFLKE